MLMVVSVASAISSVFMYTERERANTARQQADGERERANEERDRATQASAQSNATIEFLVDEMLMGSGDDTRLGHAMTVAELLDKADAKAGTALANQPEVEAAVRFALARAYAARADFEKAERQSRRSLELYQQHPGAMIYTPAQARVELMQALTAQGKHDEARQISEARLASAKQEFGLHNPGLLGAYRQVASTCVFADPAYCCLICEEGLAMRPHLSSDYVESWLELKNMYAAALINLPDNERALVAATEVVYEASQLLGHQHRATVKYTTTRCTALFNVASSEPDDDKRLAQYLELEKILEEILPSLSRERGEMQYLTNQAARLLVGVKLSLQKTDEAYRLTMDRYSMLRSRLDGTHVLVQMQLPDIMNLAATYAVDGVVDRSLELATLACEITDYEWADTLVVLAYAHALNGEFEETDRLSDRVWSMAKSEEQRQRLIVGSPGIYQSIAEAQASAGNLPSAVRWMELTLDLFPDHEGLSDKLDEYKEHLEQSKSMSKVE
jgi:tetratricopeptide (TPR) repeat protein